MMGEKIYSFALNFIKWLSCIFAGLLFFTVFIFTAYSTDMVTQKVHFKFDPVWLSALEAVVFFLLFVFFSRWIGGNPEKRMEDFLRFTLLWIGTAGLFLVLFGKTVPAADSLSVYVMAEAAAGGDLSAVHFTDSYLSYYPQQVGLMAFFEGIIRVWKLLRIDYPAYHIIKCFYVVLADLTVWFQFKSLQFIVKGKKTAVLVLYLLFMAMNLPFIMYTSFVYGEIPSLTLVSGGICFLIRYFCGEQNDKARTGKIIHLIIAAGMFVFSVFLRKNSLIFVIAVFLVMILEGIREKKASRIAFAVICMGCAVTILPVTQKFYELRAGNKINSGVPAISYLAMGMQESSRANGWYNGFNFNTYLESGLDKETTEQISREAVRERLSYFESHPGYAVDFYFYKYLSVWADGTYASRQATLATYGGRSSFFEELYEGKYSGIYISYCNFLQNLVCAGFFVFCVSALRKGRKRREIAPQKEISMWKYIPAIAIFGGFLFHMLWEANSRYAFVYGMLMVPYAACGGSIAAELFSKKESENH